jgi:TPR repeat protein
MRVLPDIDDYKNEIEPHRRLGSNIEREYYELIESVECIISHCYYKKGMMAHKHNSYIDAINYYKQADRHNTENLIADCYLKLAQCYENGWLKYPDKTDIRVARNYYQQAKDFKSSEACFWLAKDLLHPGENYSCNNEAFDLLKEAVKLGSSMATFELSKYYYQIEEFSKSDELLNRSMALGISKAFYFSGQRMEAKENLDGAVKLYKLGAIKGDYDCKLALGILYLNSNHVMYDEAKGKQLVEEAVSFYNQQTCDNMDSLYMLALCYKNGWGVEYDSKKYLDYLRVSAFMGHISAIKEVSALYSKGGYVARDSFLADLYLSRLNKPNEIMLEDTNHVAFDRHWHD